NNNNGGPAWRLQASELRVAAVVFAEEIVSVVNGPAHPGEHVGSLAPDAYLRHRQVETVPLVGHVQVVAVREESHLEVRFFAIAVAARVVGIEWELLQEALARQDD